MKLKNIIVAFIVVSAAVYAGYFYASAGLGSKEVKILPSEPAVEYGEDTSLMQKEPAGDEAERKKAVSVSIQLEHEKPQQAASDIIELTDRLGGYVEDENYFRGDEFTPETVSLVLRIPETELEEAISKIRQKGKLLSLSRATEDVTDFFNETRITLENKYAELKRLEELFNRAGTVSEILEVERELARLRAEIDNLENTLKRLENRVKYATVQVHIQAPPAVAYRFSFVRDAVQVFLNNLFGGIRFVFALTGGLIPPGVLVLIIWGTYRLIKKRG